MSRHIDIIPTLDQTVSAWLQVVARQGKVPLPEVLTGLRVRARRHCAPILMGSLSDPPQTPPVAFNTWARVAGRDFPRELRGLSRKVEKVSLQAGRVGFAHRRVALQLGDDDLAKLIRRDGWVLADASRSLVGHARDRNAAAFRGTLGFLEEELGRRSLMARLCETSHQQGRLAVMLYSQLVGVWECVLGSRGGPVATVVGCLALGGALFAGWGRSDNAS